MSIEWLSKPIVCDGAEVSPAIDWSGPLLTQRAEVAFKIHLLMNAWSAYACDGRQLSIDDAELMGEYSERLKHENMDEDTLRKIIVDFGNYLPNYLRCAPASIVVPMRALIWTKKQTSTF